MERYTDAELDRMFSRTSLYRRIALGFVAAVFVAMLAYDAYDFLMKRSCTETCGLKPVVECTDERALCAVNVVSLPTKEEK